MTLKELYENEKQQQTPAQSFVERVANAARASEATVRSWLCGSRNPDQLAKEAIAKEFGTTVDELFPEERKLDHEPYNEE